MMRYQFFQIIVIMTVTLLLTPNSALSDDVIQNPKMYPTTLRFVPKKSPQHKVVFYWSAISKDTRRVFSEIVLPIITYKEQTQTYIVMDQIFDSDISDASGPGALLLCADNSEHYAALVQLYEYENLDPSYIGLSSVADKTGESYHLNQAWNVLQTKLNLTLNNCFANPYFYLRRVYQISKTNYFYELHKNQTLPLIFLDGNIVSEKDPKLQELMNRKLN